MINHLTAGLVYLLYKISSSWIFSTLSQLLLLVNLLTSIGDVSFLATHNQAQMQLLDRKEGVYASFCKLVHVQGLILGFELNLLPQLSADN